ncbi:TetR/AcrR family transcriptional regulator [uncultured Vagococcus sp.]|uniref:TetR/AcrR family transcriptional regulator n=1 Tax=uncultured Vagococcus sp. TaxID=189676 RepID=UPI0028D1D365|nr:TetR/AcrR family transcriptional regulator [uncultured Vagococcus sp.]
MAKGPKGFSEDEKELLRSKLRLKCEESWALHGYKKTSISELTASIGISTGAFYLLYPSKEELFCETLARVQEQLTTTLRQVIKEVGGLEGFRQAMIWHFDEYDKRPFLYDFNSPDFLAFINKLPQVKIDLLKFDSVASFEEMIQLTGLTLAISQEKAFAALSSLLYTVTNKERVSYDHREVFSFLLDGLLLQLFTQ